MADTLIRLRDDVAADVAAVPLDAFLADPSQLAVRLVPGDDARAVLARIDRIELIEVAFPAYTDGRGYSAARTLREHGYRGELRAVGDVLLDQVSHMARVGFDAFAPNQPLSRDAVDAAIATWPAVYQRTVDGRAPIWALRHG